MQKIENALIQWYLKARVEMLKLEQEEDGMEMMEAIILIAIAVIIGGVIVNALGDENGGLIGTIWEKVEEWLDGIFGRQGG